MNNTSRNHLPPCPHYSVCGGCSLQHLGIETYYDYKQNILTKTIASLGLPVSIIRPIIPIGEHSRRRAEFKVSVQKGVVRIGFFGAKSHDVFDLDVCLVTDDRLIEIIPNLKKCLQSLKKPGAIKAISLTILDSGLDATIIRHTPLNSGDKDILIRFAQENGFIRLNEKEGDNCRSLTQSDAVVTFGEYEVKLPSGAFLQATEAGQIAITELVAQYLQHCDKVADLYSGCGTYSFPMVESVQYISAFEGAGDMVAAMHNAITHYNLEGRMSVSVRDLYKTPLGSKALSHFDGVVINPPRNGALPQIKQIAKSKIEHVVMVSCNPATFKRDAEWLLDYDYKLVEATAIDQFYWNHHLEVVALFVRK